MRHYLTYKDDKSDKFWQIEVAGKSFTVTYGKTGTAGTSQTKKFESKEECLGEAEKLLNEKIKKGYTKGDLNTSSQELDLSLSENITAYVHGKLKYLIQSKEDEKILSAILKRVSAVEFNSRYPDTLKIWFYIDIDSYEILVLDAPLKRGKFSRWPLDFQALIKQHTTVSFADSNVILGDHGTFDLSFKKVFGDKTSNQKVLSPMVFYADWYVYRPAENKQDEGCTLHFFSHSHEAISKPIDKKISSIFLGKLNDHLGKKTIEIKHSENKRKSETIPVLGKPCNLVIEGNKVQIINEKDNSTKETFFLHPFTAMVTYEKKVDALKKLAHECSKLNYWSDLAGSQKSGEELYKHLNTLCTSKEAKEKLRKICEQVKAIEIETYRGNYDSLKITLDNHRVILGKPIEQERTDERNYSGELNTIKEKHEYIILHSSDDDDFLLRLEDLDELSAYDFESFLRYYNNLAASTGTKEKSHLINLVKECTKVMGYSCHVKEFIHDFMFISKDIQLLPFEYKIVGIRSDKSEPYQYYYWMEFDEYDSSDDAKRNFEEYLKKYSTPVKGSLFDVFTDHLFRIVFSS